MVLEIFSMVRGAEEGVAECEGWSVQVKREGKSVPAVGTACAKTQTWERSWKTGRSGWSTRAVRTVGELELKVIEPGQAFILKPECSCSQESFPGNLDSRTRPGLGDPDQGLFPTSGCL